MNNGLSDIHSGQVVLQAENICKTFGHDGRSVEVLRGVNLSIAPGEMIAIVGASGSYTGRGAVDM